MEQGDGLPGSAQRYGFNIRQLPIGTFAAVDQRIATCFHIAPMDLCDSIACLRHQRVPPLPPALRR